MKFTCHTLKCCLKCGYKTNVRSNFKRHTLTCRGPKPSIKETHSCPKCEYQTKNTSHFKRHTLTCQGPKPSITETHSCLKCGYKTKNTSHFKRHTLTCQGPKPSITETHSCLKCGYKTNIRSNFKRHTLTCAIFKHPVVPGFGSSQKWETINSNPVMLKWIQTLFPEYGDDVKVREVTRLKPSKRKPNKVPVSCVRLLGSNINQCKKHPGAETFIYCTTEGVYQRCEIPKCQHMEKKSWECRLEDVRRKYYTCQVLMNLFLGASNMPEFKEAFENYKDRDPDLIKPHPNPGFRRKKRRVAPIFGKNPGLEKKI